MISFSNNATNNPLQQCSYDNMISFSNNDTNNHLQQSSYDNMISFSNNNPLQQSSYDNMAKDIQLDPASDYNQKSYAFGMDPVSLQFTSLTNSYTLQFATVLVIYLFCLYYSIKLLFSPTIVIVIISLQISRYFCNLFYRLL